MVARERGGVGGGAAGARSAARAEVGAREQPRRFRISVDSVDGDRVVAAVGGDDEIAAWVEGDLSKATRRGAHAWKAGGAREAVRKHGPNRERTAGQGATKRAHFGRA